MSNSIRLLITRLLRRIGNIFTGNRPAPAALGNTEDRSASPWPTVAPQPAPEVVLAASAVADVGSDDAQASSFEPGANDMPAAEPVPELSARETVVPAISARPADQFPEVRDALGSLKGAEFEMPVAVAATPPVVEPRKARSRKSVAASIPEEQSLKPARKSRSRKAAEVVPQDGSDPVAAPKPARRKPRSEVAPVADTTPLEAQAPSVSKSAARKPRAKPATAPASGKPRAARKPKVTPGE
ncbi:hypothetical protein [Paracoccus sp. ME4]|uniref:hypothetical protein n=1 Tax=Paracoccus sp. ME4 TaxID=3138066 RepID=UPI00398A8E3E